LFSLKYNLPPKPPARVPLFVEAPITPSVDGGETSSLSSSLKTYPSARTNPDLIAGLEIGIGAIIQVPRFFICGFAGSS
jgi:hypothetical protein